MTTTQATPTYDSKQKRFKGSLAGTFIRTLLIITFIPLALMAGAAYLHARTLLQQQAVTQSQSLLSSQLKVIDREIINKESHLEHLFESSDFTILTELALHANPQSDEFRNIRNNILLEFKNQGAQEDAPAIDQYLLLDTNGNIKIATNANWQGMTITPSIFKQTAEHHSIVLFGLSPLYENEFVLVTVQEYKTKRGSILGSVVGITEKKNLHKLIQPLNGLSPLATTYFVLSDQRFVSSEPDTGEFKLVDSTSLSKINSVFSELMTQETPQPESLDIKTPDGEAALAQLQWFPRLQAGIVLAVKSDTIYSQVASLIPFTTLLILGALLATGLVIVIGVNRVIKPLHSLSDITRSFADGDLSRRAKVTTNDEVGVLAGSFNQMADELGKAHLLVEQKADEGGLQSQNTIEAVQTKPISSSTNIATQPVGLTETNRDGFDEFARLYQSSKMIAEANTAQEILEIGSQILKEAPYPVIVLHNQDKKLTVFSFKDSTRESVVFPKFSEANTEKVEKYLLNAEIFTTTNNENAPSVLKYIMQELDFDNAACLPVRKNGELNAVLMIGGRNQTLSMSAIQPYINLADLMSISMEKAGVIQQTKKNLRDAEALASITEAILTSTDQQVFFTTLHDRLRQSIGNYDMTILLYDEKSNTISIPFNYEDQKISSIKSAPLEEGLMSVLIRTRQPLMLVEDVERKTAELGAKITEKTARSWMGAPMLVQNNLIGALIIQDKNNEHAFDEDDLKFFIAVAGQVAGVMNNAHLLEESRHRTIQLETAAEIARDISSSLNLDELLVKAVNFIRERFDFYHASVFLHDLQGEFTVIREATGETGSQMKRSGYKIAIGSKSIVGFVSSRGEQLVVDNTAKDATYYANPLFPNTRSEAAFPLKVGERILGEIDVQSINPYAFTEDKLRSLQILADQMAIAVVNTELFSETQEHLSQHRLLHHITTTAASGTTLEEALEGAVNGLQVTLGGDRVTILLTNREKNSLEVKASTGYAEDITKVEVPIGNGITGWAAAHKRPLRVRNVTEDPRYIAVSSNTRSELAVPLVYRNELLGVLNVESELVDAYSENDEEMLGTLGGSLAAIIANARLVEQIRIQAERDRLIYEVTSKIRRSTDIQSIMSTTASELARLTGAQYAKIQIKPENNTKQEGAK
jgi:GAF domain-containing protein/HAMP domain-containing protein